MVILLLKIIWNLHRFWFFLCLLFTRLKKPFNVWSFLQKGIYMRLYSLTETFLITNFSWRRNPSSCYRRKMTILLSHSKLLYLPLGYFVSQIIFSWQHTQTFPCCVLGCGDARLTIRAEAQEFQTSLWLSWIVETAYEHGLGPGQKQINDFKRTFTVF